MRQTLISLMRKAVYTLKTQWSIDPAHLQSCESFFSFFESLLNHEGLAYEEKYEEDGDSYTYNFTYRSSNDLYEFRSNGRLEQHSITLWDYDDGPSFTLRYSKTSYSGGALRDQETYIWDANFDEKKQLYSIRVQKDDGNIGNRKTLWAYKYNQRL